MYIIRSTFTSFCLHLHHSICLALSLNLQAVCARTCTSFHLHLHESIYTTIILCTFTHTSTSYYLSLLSLSICTHTCLALSLNLYTHMYRQHLHQHLHLHPHLSFSKSIRRYLQAACTCTFTGFHLSSLFFNVYIHMYRGATGRGHIQPGEGGPRGRRIHA